MSIIMTDQGSILAELESLIIEQKDGTTSEYLPAEDFVYKGKRYVAYHSRELDDSIICEATQKDGRWMMDMLDESIEEEVTQYYANLPESPDQGIPNPPPDPEAPAPMQPKPGPDQVKEHLAKKYAIAEGLPDWDLLPPSVLIERKKRA